MSDENHTTRLNSQTSIQTYFDANSETYQIPQETLNQDLSGEGQQRTPPPLPPRTRSLNGGVICQEEKDASEKVFTMG